MNMYIKAITSCFAILLAVLLIMGCSQSRPGGGSGAISFSDGTEQQGPLENETDLLYKLRTADLKCAEDCPSNVGLVFLNRTDGISSQLSQCTGFLVSDKVVATNSHCIPDHLKTSGTDCSADLSIRFFDVKGHSRTVYSCKRVLSHSPLGLFDPDYAFFEIESTGRPAFKISKAGLRDGQLVSVLKVTPSSSGPAGLGGYLEKSTCEIALNTFLNFKSHDAWSKTAVAMGCLAEGGNSGSPILNAEGKVIGILQAKMKEKWALVIEQAFKEHGLKVPRQMPAHILFTNLSCVSDPINPAFAKDRCKASEKLKLGDCLQMQSNPSTLANVSRVLGNWQTSLPDIFVYEFMTDAKLGQTRATPMCVKTEQQMTPGRYGQFVTLTGIYGLRKETISIDYPRAVQLQGTPKLQSDYRLSREIDFYEAQRIIYKLNLKNENDTWIGFMHSTYTNKVWNIDLTRTQFPLALKSCTDEQVKAAPVAKAILKDGTVVNEGEYLANQDPPMVCDGVSLGH